MSPGKSAVAATAVACMTLLSVGWSGQNGVSLSVQSAQARTSHKPTQAGAAHVAHRHTQRQAYGRGPGPGPGPNPLAVGADIAAGAVGTAAGVAAAATSPWGYYGGPGPYAGPVPGDGYYAGSPWGEYECRAPHAYDCRPYGSKDWWGR